MCVWGVQGFGAHRGARVHDSRIPLHRWRQWNYSYATGKARHIWGLMHVACTVARVSVHANVFAGLLCLRARDIFVAVVLVLVVVVVVVVRVWVGVFLLAFQPA